MPPAVPIAPSPPMGQMPAYVRPNVSNLWVWLLILWPLVYGVLFGAMGGGATLVLIVISTAVNSVLAWQDEKTVKAAGYKDRAAPWAWVLLLVPIYLVIRQKRIQGSQWPVFTYIGFSLVGLVTAVVVAAAVAVADEATSTPEGTYSQQEDSGTQNDSEISQGLGSADASGDVTLGAVSAGDGVTEVVVNVKNNSSEPSDYSIELAAESRDGAEQYDTAFVFISGLKPGQSKSDKAAFLSSIPSDAVIKVTEIQRTSSL